MKKQERSARFVFLLCLLFWSTISSAQVDYCIPEVLSEDLYITKFKFNTIDNPSGNNGYTFYPIMTTVEPGQVYNYSVTFPGGSGFKYYAIYADFDGDGFFTGTNEQLVNISTPFDHEVGTVIIPTGLTDIETRLRVMVDNKPIFDPCMNIDNGEIEDYQLRVANSVDEDFVVVLTTRDSENMDEESCSPFEFTINHDMCSGGPVPMRRVYLYCYLDQQGTAGAPPFNLASGRPSVSCSLTHSGLIEVDLAILFPNITLVTGTNYILRVYQDQCNSDSDCLPDGRDGYAVHFRQGQMCPIILNSYGIDWSPLYFRTGHDDIHNNEVDQQDITAEESDIDVYPNPFRDQLQIDFQLSYAAPASIYLTDATGRRVRTFSNLDFYDKGPHSQNLSTVGLPGGLYLLTFESGEQRITRRVFKSH